MPEDSAKIYRPGFLGSRKEDNQCPSQQSEHFVGVFACFDVDGVNEKPLLAFSVLPDETDLGADSIAGFIETTLEYYKKTRTDVKFIVSDNEPTMRGMAKKLVNPMIGCASHRISLAVKHWLVQNDQKVLLEKVNCLMKKSSNLKQAGKLRKKKQFETRHSQYHQMVVQLLYASQISRIVTLP